MGGCCREVYGQLVQQGVGGGGMLQGGIWTVRIARCVCVCGGGGGMLQGGILTIRTARGGGMLQGGIWTIRTARCVCGGGGGGGGCCREVYGHLGLQGFSSGSCGHVLGQLVPVSHLLLLLILSTLIFLRTLAPSSVVLGK